MLHHCHKSISKDKEEVARILNGAVRNGGIPEIVYAHLAAVRMKGRDKPCY